MRHYPQKSLYYRHSSTRCSSSGNLSVAPEDSWCLGERKRFLGNTEKERYEEATSDLRVFGFVPPKGEYIDVVPREKLGEESCSACQLCDDVCENLIECSLCVLKVSKLIKAGKLLKLGTLKQLRSSVTTISLLRRIKNVVERLFNFSPTSTPFSVSSSSSNPNNSNNNNNREGDETSNLLMMRQPTRHQVDSGEQFERVVSDRYPCEEGSTDELVRYYAKGRNTRTLYSSCEIRRHNTLEDAWIVAHGIVYDVTEIIQAHPGGWSTFENAVGGQRDCGRDFDFHAPEIRRKLWASVQIGRAFKCS